jgi:hypothetical protein
MAGRAPTFSAECAHVPYCPERAQPRKDIRFLSRGEGNQLKPTDELE